MQQRSRRPETAYTRIVSEFVKTAGESGVVFDNLQALWGFTIPSTKCMEAIRIEMNTRFRDRWGDLLVFVGNQVDGRISGMGSREHDEAVERELRVGMWKAAERVYVTGVKRPQAVVSKTD